MRCLVLLITLFFPLAIIQAWDHHKALHCYQIIQHEIQKQIEEELFPDHKIVYAYFSTGILDTILITSPSDQVIKSYQFDYDFDKNGGMSLSASEVFPLTNSFIVDCAVGYVLKLQCFGAQRTQK